MWNTDGPRTFSTPECQDYLTAIEQYQREGYNLAHLQPLYDLYTELRRTELEEQ